VGPIVIYCDCDMAGGKTPGKDDCVGEGMGKTEVEGLLRWNMRGDDG